MVQVLWCKKKTIADILLSDLAKEQGLQIVPGIQGDEDRSRAVCKDYNTRYWPKIYIGLHQDGNMVFFRFEPRMPQPGEPDDGKLPDSMQLVNVFFEQLCKQALEVTEVDSPR